MPKLMPEAAHNVMEHLSYTYIKDGASNKTSRSRKQSKQQTHIKELLKKRGQKQHKQTFCYWFSPTKKLNLYSSILFKPMNQMGKNQTFINLTYPGIYIKHKSVQKHMA